MSIIRDDFAGPGGWEEGLRILREEQGLVHDRCIGVEHEASAVATARAAGQTRLHADVREMVWHLGHLSLSGYITSAPCQTFSPAGNGAGRKHLDKLRAAALLVADGASPDEAIARVHDEALDERSVLVLHPLTVVRDALAEGLPIPWLAFEQVPQVLPIWLTYAEILEGWGYCVDTGYVHAEEYGVAQTRKRAVLTAVWDPEGRRASAPWPKKTHSRYHNRTPEKLDAGYPSWVSIADALGVAESVEFVSNYGTGGDPAARGVRTGAEPSATVTSKYDRFKVFGDVRAANGTVRPIDSPAPTLTSSMDNGNFRFAGAGATSQRTSGQIPREPSQPAHTITGKATAAWTSGDGVTERRVTVQEAGVLQSFPADYPWQGNKGQQFQQVGNAIPPRLAAAILGPLLRATDSNALESSLPHPSTPTR